MYRITHITLALVSEEQVEARREVSAALFNNRYLVDVVVGIASLARANRPAITTRAIANEVGLSDNLVRPVVLRLLDTGLLSPLPRAGGPRSLQPFEIVMPSTWKDLARLAGRLSAADE